MIHALVPLIILSSITPAAGSKAEIPSPQQMIEEPCLTPAQSELDARLTGIFPTCSELSETGVPVARKVGHDWILVLADVERDRYVKVAISLSSIDGTPVVTWQGAGLSGAISQACSGDAPGETNPK